MSIIFPIGTTIEEDFLRDDIRDFLSKHSSKVKVKVWIPTDSNDGFWSTIKRLDFDRNFENFYPNHFDRIKVCIETKTIFIIPKKIYGGRLICNNGGVA